MAEQTARWLVVLAVLLPQAPLNGAAASEPRQPVLNAVPMNALFSGPKVHLTARTSGGPQPQGAPGEPAVDPGAGEAVQPPQSIFDDFPADDSERLLQHSGNETATEAGREYIGDDSTGYCFNEHGKVDRHGMTWNVCFVGFFVFICVATCAVRNWTGRHQQFLQGGDDNMHNNDHDDIDPARNDPRDKFDSAPFTQVNDRRARDVSPGAERSRAPMRRNITAPARMMGSSPARRAIDLRGDFDPVDHFRSEHDEDLDYGSNGPEIAGDNMAREMARAMHAAEGDRVGRAVEPGGAQPSQPSGRPRRNVGQPDRYDQTGLHLQSYRWNTQPFLRWPN